MQFFYELRINMKDDNSVSIIYGVSSVDGVTILPLKIDPVTGRVLAEIDTTLDVPPVLQDRAIKDDNSVSTMLCVADDDSGVLPLMIDSTNNEVFIDLVIE